ncbi:MAG: heavy-metal-associated domain-containing protein [Croceibacterium sp.]
MASILLPPPIAPRRVPLGLAAALLMATAGAIVWAQVSGDRGLAPVAASTDIEVHGVAVNTTGKTAEEARENGWREAQKLAWIKIGGPALADNQIAGMVSAIVIERERLGPHRYIATLGVVFDRTRAGPLLGGAQGQVQRSAPLLTLPVMITGGTQTMYEVRGPWQRAWAEFQGGGSAIDYVRPNGSGSDSLLLTYGQTARRSRTWWADILDQFGASDVIVPIARLRYAFPGGPIDGEFTARYGPDSRFLGSFKLHANSADGLQAMLDQAVRRFDAMFSQALAAGTLKPDPTLSTQNVELSPTVLALIEASRRAEAQEAALRAGEAPGAVATPATPATLDPATSPATPAQAISNFTVQVATPDSSAIDAALAALRSVPNTYGTSTSSVAVGGTSVMRVSYAGTLGELAAALRGRGWTVTQGANALAISR